MLKHCNLFGVLAAGLALWSVCSDAQAAGRSSARLLNDRTSPSIMNVSLKGSDHCTPPECKTYKPCIDYRGCCDCCGPKVKQVLRVKDPCDCCCELAEIPVCLPACCKHACVSSRCGLFGRSIVTYSYDCGVCVTIVFRRCGDVIVKYSC